MRSGKWFSKLVAQTPLDEAAATVLESRSEAIRHRLVRVLDGPDQDPEDVHQLRVATRRLAAALSVFRGSIPGPRHRILRVLARSIRRAAGDLRDLDVLEQLLQDRLKRAAHTVSPIYADCARVLARRRHAAQRHLQTVAKSTLRHFEKALAATREHLTNGRLRADTKRDLLGKSAATILRKRLKRLRRAARAELEDLDALHQLRIAAKRLRYAMEIFAGCYSARFRHDYYTRIEKIQEELGHVNDLRNLLGLLRHLRQDLRRTGHGRVSKHQAAVLKVVGRSVRSELKACRQAFQRHWSAAKFDTFHKEFKGMLCMRPPMAIGSRRWAGSKFVKK